MFGEALHLSIRSASVLSFALLASNAFAGNAVYTTTNTGITVNSKIYSLSTDVYISGGPENTSSSGLADGMYYFQVTDSSGTILLSTDIARCRQLVVSGDRVHGASGPACKHTNGTFNPLNNTLPVQLYPFSPTPNPGSEYKVWLIAQTPTTLVSTSDPKVLIFNSSDSNTSNFKVQNPLAPPPPGSCQGSSSLTVLVTGTNVIGYVPKGNWSITHTTGISVVNIEGTTVANTVVPTPGVVNSCASNALSGQTVCTANDTDVYLLSGTALTKTLSSSGSNQIFFSGGICTNCGVAIDAIHNKAAIGLSLGGRPGFQILDLGATPSFEAPFTSPAGLISEDPLFDPTRNLLLSPTELNDYEIVNLTTSTTPAFFEHSGIQSGGELDSAAEECGTGIALAPAEFSSPSRVFVADLSQATFTPGSPGGTWVAPSEVQTLSESFLSAGASGSAIAQGTHTGLISGEFGGNTVTAIALPPTSGTGVPAITDWVTCQVGGGFVNGYDPHTVTAYQSPNSGDAISVLANAGASSLAVIDLTSMLNPAIVPRTTGGHGCASGTLPSGVLSFIVVP
jgi:hypothetical protein